jgi:hypothetical protein
MTIIIPNNFINCYLPMEFAILQTHSMGMIGIIMGHFRWVIENVTPKHPWLLGGVPERS